MRTIIGLVLSIMFFASGCAGTKQKGETVTKNWLKAYNAVYKNGAVQKTIKSTDSLIIDSHVVGMAKRPVSSTYRLFAWTKGTTFDIVDPRGKIPTFLINKDIPPLYEGAPMDLAAFEAHLDNKVKEPLSNGSMQFLIGGEEFFERFEKALRKAERSIHLRIFIFDNDDYAVKVADILKKKAAEGVKVQVLLDGIGQVMGEGKTAETLPEDFDSPGSMVAYLKKDSDIEVRKRPNTWFKADHTKTIIIDEDILFTGGMNIGREYRYDWHDLMIEIEGPIVGAMLNEFNMAWEHSGALGDLAYAKSLFTKDKKEPMDETSDLPVIRPLYTRANDFQIFKAQVEAIKWAKKYIYISNAYFSDETIINELIRARQRGVDVRVIMPAKGNHAIMNKNNLVAANKLFDRGIQVYFYPGMSHIKAAVYDGWMTTGSANFDKLSFRDNLEFNIATSDKETVDRFIKRLFEPDFEKSFLMEEKFQTSIKEHLAEFLAEQL